MLEAPWRHQLHQQVERIPAAPSAHSPAQLRSARRDMALSCAAVEQHPHEVRHSLRRVSPASMCCRTGHSRSPRTTHGRSSCTRCSDSHWWWFEGANGCMLPVGADGKLGGGMDGAAANSSASNAASRASASSASRNSTVPSSLLKRASRASSSPSHRVEAGVSKYVALIWRCRTLRSLGWRSLQETKPFVAPAWRD